MKPLSNVHLPKELSKGRASLNINIFKYYQKKIMVGKIVGIQLLKKKYIYFGQEFMAIKKIII